MNMVFTILFTSFISFGLGMVWAIYLLRKQYKNQLRGFLPYFYVPRCGDVTQKVAKVFEESFKIYFGIK